MRNTFTSKYVWEYESYHSILPRAELNHLSTRFRSNEKFYSLNSQDKTICVNLSPFFSLQTDLCFLLFSNSSQPRVQLHAATLVDVSRFNDKSTFHIARTNSVVSLHVAVSLFRCRKKEVRVSAFERFCRILCFVLRKKKV